MSLELNLKRTALIVGGTGTIGAGVAEALAAEHNLILVFRQNRMRAEALRDRLLQNHDIRIELLEKNLRTPGDIEELTQKVLNLVPDGAGILVNSFGSFGDELFLTQKPGEIEHAIFEHLLLPALLSHAAARSMCRAGYGRIINIGSISGAYVKRGQVAYAAAKAGLEGLTKSLAMEVAGRAVTVNLIRPGLVESPATKERIARAPGRKLQQIVPLGILPQASEIGAMVRYLCSENARSVTGASLTIDAGRSLGDAFL